MKKTIPFFKAEEIAEKSWMIKNAFVDNSYAICYLANIVFPRSGEVVRCGLMAETKKTTFEGALGTVVIERTWDLLCMVLAVVPLLFFGHFRDFLVEKMFRPLVPMFPTNSLQMNL